MTSANIARTYEILPGHPVARIGYGTMQLQREADTPQSRQAGAHLLRHARELGVNHMDTAHFYGHGTVLEVMAEALSPYSQDLVVVSKVGLVNLPDGRFTPAQQPQQIREQVEHTLSVLGRDHLEGVNMRRMDHGRFRAEGEQKVPLEDQLEVLLELRQEGKIQGIGLSHATAEAVRTALPVGLFGVQNAYNLLSRGDEDVLEICRENGLAYVPYFPLGSHNPAFPHVTEDAVVQEAAQRLEATPSQVGLAWLLQHSPNILLIPGTSSVAHLEENMAAADLVLPPDVVQALDAEGDLEQRLGT